MSDTALQSTWFAIRQDFDQARSLLPSPTLELEGNLNQLNEWLDLNELELALAEMESLGKDNASPSAYWNHLRLAARRMGLKSCLTRP